MLPNENGAGAAAAATDDDDGAPPNENGAGAAAAAAADDDGDDDDECNECNDVVPSGCGKAGSGGICCELVFVLKAIPRDASCGRDFLADPIGDGGGRPRMLGDAVPGDATLVLSTGAPRLGTEEGRVLAVAVSEGGTGV